MTQNVTLLTDSYIKVTLNIINLVLNQLKRQLFNTGRPQLCVIPLFLCKHELWEV